VLSGGGSLGAVQVGALRALLEAGVKPDLFIGCSVGALNAAALAMSPTLARLDEIEAIWRSLDRKDVFGGNRRLLATHLVRGDDHLYEPDALRALVRRTVPIADLADTQVPCHVVTTDLQSHATSNVSNVAQAAALEAVSGDLSAVADMRTAFDRRRRTMVRLLNEIPGVTCPEPFGAFYCYPSVKGLLGKTLRGRTPTTSAQLAELLLDEAGVAVVPGEAFGTPGYFRLSYALGDDDLEKGVRRMGELFAEAE
jgi:hypothetical protein